MPQVLRKLLREYKKHKLQFERGAIEVPLFDVEFAISLHLFFVK